MRYFIPILFILSACGRGTIDPAFTEYVTRFEDASRAAGNEVTVTNTIRFGDVHGDAILAVCDGGTVTVDKNAWNAGTDINREEIIFHELGHCALGLQHRNDTHWDSGLFYSVSNSVMNISLVDINAYKAHHADYMRELFGKN